MMTKCYTCKKDMEIPDEGITVKSMGEEYKFMINNCDDCFQLAEMEPEEQR
jgi:hypothetical protein